VERRLERKLDHPFTGRAQRDGALWTKQIACLLRFNDLQINAFTVDRAGKLVATAGSDGFVRVNAELLEEDFCCLPMLTSAPSLCFSLFLKALSPFPCLSIYLFLTHTHTHTHTDTHTHTLTHTHTHTHTHNVH
jgi:hypothetical protein